MQCETVETMCNKTMKMSTTERPRRSTANYNRSYALDGQGRKKGRDCRVAAKSRSMDQVRRNNRESAEEADDGQDGEGSNESERDDGSYRGSAGENVSVVRRFRGSKSSVYNYLLASPDCCNSYADSSFTILCRGRHGYGLQLKVLKAIYQRLYKLA